MTANSSTPLEKLGAVPAGEKVINNFRHASAVYYIESKRWVVVGEDPIDLRKALAGLEEKVARDDRCH